MRNAIHIIAITASFVLLQCAYAQSGGCCCKEPEPGPQTNCPGGRMSPDSIAVGFYPDGVLEVYNGSFVQVYELTSDGYVAIIPPQQAHFTYPWMLPPGSLVTIFNEDSCKFITQTPDCEGTPGGPAMPGIPCDDGDPLTANDFWQPDCICMGEPADCEGTPGGPAMPGIPCDDGDPCTSNDIYMPDCICMGDDPPPTAVCKDATIQLDASGNGSLAGMEIDGGSFDNCGIVSFSASPNVFGCNAIGANSVTLTVVDNAGNVDACTASVFVTDNISPSALCRMRTVFLDASGNATIAETDIDDGSSDNCGPVNLSLDKTTFGCPDIGGNTVKLTVADASGYTAHCTTGVTVWDTIPPTASCRDITLQLDASGLAAFSAADIDNGSSDACGISMFASQPDFTCQAVGVNAVTLTVTDGNGNTSTCSSNVLVEDNHDVAALCKDVSVELGGEGIAGIVAEDVDNGSGDNCGIAGLAVNPGTFDCVDLGVVPVTLTVTNNNGDTASCMSGVWVSDNIPPVASCTAPLPLQVDQSGYAWVTNEVMLANIYFGDNCGIANIVANPDYFGCNDTGASTTVVVSDQSGNTSSCSANVEVYDNLPPTAVCQDATVQLDASGNASISSTEIDGGSFDNCGIMDMSVSPADFNCGNLGANPVTLTVTDMSANLASCSSTVTVEDNQGLSVCDCDMAVVYENTNSLPDTTFARTISAGDFGNGGVVVPLGDSVAFRARDYIKLENGFEAETGASFSAQIEECPNGSPAAKTLPDMVTQSKSLTVFPNPFKDEVVVTYQLPNETLVRLELYTLSGELVKTIVNGDLQDEGSYRIALSNCKLAPGIYICALQTNSARETVKLVKAK